LTGYKNNENSLSGIPEFPELTELNLYVTNIASLSGIEKQAALERLMIFRAPKLTSIAELVKLKKINNLEIESCKNINDFEVLASLKNLNRLIISESGEFKSLEFLKSLPSLEFFSFWGTNVIDGDLSYLEKLPGVGFNDKRHYSLKMAHFEKKNALYREKALKRQ
jgi:Leucine-rich repeat (LRR) protein